MRARKNDNSGFVDLEGVYLIGNKQVDDVKSDREEENTAYRNPREVFGVH